MLPTIPGIKARGQHQIHLQHTEKILRKHSSTLFLKKCKKPRPAKRSLKWAQRSWHHLLKSYFRGEHPAYIYFTMGKSQSAKALLQAEWR